MTLPAATRMGPVRLVAHDIDALTAFYARVLGLEVIERGRSLARLGAGGEALVELEAGKGAPVPAARATGLFHLALLVPDRAELARALHRVARAGWGFTGASDHLVSEALYLDDPEGNGIEVYRDRPRDEWRRSADGELEMATLPLDVEAVLGALPGEAGDAGMPDGTVVGHVHLRVSDLAAADAFYVGALGFAATVRGYPGALFVAAGGYHHHLGLNTWGSRGAPAPPPGARGLARYRGELPDPASLDVAAARLSDAGHAVTARADGVLVADPAGNRVLLAGTA
jgi:catechol 2,3-dioxygenase